MIKHNVYNTWSNMKSRCYNKNDIAFKNYGGRGITVCDRWLNSFENFRNDMLTSYKEGLSIDRIDNNGNYEPSNCRWSTRTTQQRNTRKLRSSNTSGYRGVCWYKAGNKWASRVKVNNKQIHLGYFDIPIDAAKAYDTYVINNNLEHTINCVV